MNFNIKGDVADITETIPGQPLHPCTIVLVESVGVYFEVITPPSVLGDLLPLLCAGRPVSVGGELKHADGRMHHVATWLRLLGDGH